MRNRATDRRATAHTNGDNTEAHRDGVLDSKMSEASSSTRENNPVTDVSVGVLDGAVNGKTLRKSEHDVSCCHMKATNRTEDGSGFCAVHVGGNGGDVVRVGHDVFLESTVDGETAVLSLVADWNGRS